MRDLERCGWPALACCLLLSTAHAEGTHGHSAMLTVQGDEHDNWQWLSRLALPLGDHAWMQGSFGSTELGTAPARNIKTVGAAMGIGGRTVDAAVEFVRRTGDGRFEQQDWAAALNWHGARGGLGADVFLRSAGSESTTTTSSGGVFSPPVTQTVRGSVDSTGFGLHGALDLTPRAKVFAGAMRYRHDFSFDSAAADPGTSLTSVLGIPAALSGVWRDQAFIDHSYRVGGSYRFEGAAVNAQYFHDRTANTGETLNTVQLQAEFLLAGHWLVSPMMGYSSGAHAEQTGYGGLSVGFIW